MPALVLGPMVRYVDSEFATIWLQTDAACDVEILGRRASKTRSNGCEARAPPPTG